MSMSQYFVHLWCRDPVPDGSMCPCLLSRQCGCRGGRLTMESRPAGLWQPNSVLPFWKGFTGAVGLE
eukprot:15243738-Alexandrium_andersonii.AAC.1